MDNNEFIELLSNVKALEMIVRSLVARGFSMSPNPQQDAFNFFEFVIAGLSNASGQENEANRKFYGMVEDDIRLFAQAIYARLEQSGGAKG